MNVKNLIYKDIGEVSFCKHKKAKHLKIVLNANGKIRVTMPDRATFSQAYEFIDSKYSWIKENIKKLEKRKPEKLIFDENTSFNTKYHALNLIKYNGSQCKKIINGQVLEFFYPKSADIYSCAIQDAIKYAVRETLRQESKNYLPQRLEQLSKKYSFKYKRVFIKNLRSRWGSCSAVNNINLNLHLMRLPDNLIDYVLLHELVHTVEKNHGKNFWNAMNKIIPEAKQVNNELKKYKIEFF